MRLILASASPRRLELLAQLGIVPDVVASDIDEHRLAGETPVEYSRRIAQEKGLAVAQRFLGESVLVLSADTEVVLGEEVFGKPRDDLDAARMLRRLSGIEHQVISSVCLIDCSQVRLATRVLTQTTHVRMRELSDQDIAIYISSGESRGKAGAYAIQGRAAAFIERIDGSHSSVMGLPLFETAQLLAL